MIVVKKNITSEGYANYLVALPNFKLVSWVTDKEQLQDEYQIHRPHCVILGVTFFGCETAQAIKRFREKNTDANILISTYFVNKTFVSDVMEAGAKGVISTIDSTFDQLVEAVRVVANGRTYLCQAAMEALLGGLFSSEVRVDGNADMSQREKQIIRMIAEGSSSKEIARVLDIAPSTVDAHRKNIMRKIGCHKVTDITRYAIRSSLLEA